MKKFTVKDFIHYNAPCFSCGSKIKISVISTRLNETIGVDGSASPTQLRPTISTENLEVDLKITYDQILKLFINLTTNKFITTNFKGLTKYLDEHKLYLRSYCEKCFTGIETFFLEFNLQKGFVMPVGICNERLIVSDEINTYTVYTSFMEEKSNLYVDRLDKTHPISPLKIQLVPIPLYRFKNKDNFLKKMKTYLIFS